MSQPPTGHPAYDTPAGATPIHTLTRLGERLTSAIQPAIAVRYAAEAVSEVLTPDRLAVVLSDPATNRLSTAYDYHYGTSGPDDPLIRLVIRQGSRVLRSVTPEALAALGGAPDPGVRSWIGAAVPAAGQTIGAIVAASRHDGHFAEWHLDFLNAAAAQLGLALANARLIELLSSGKREWEQTVDAIGQAFCVLDDTGAIHRANRAFSALVGVPVTALARQPWLGVLPPHWAEPVARVLAAEDGAAPREVRAGARVFTVSAFRLSGAERLAVLVFEDQTDKRRLQEQLIQSEKMSAMGQLIAGVAHDLNNPLASVVGFAEYLAEEGRGVPPHLRRPLEAIRQQAERAASIVRNLLSFARKHEGERRAVSIVPVLKATLQLLNNQLTACKVQAKLHVARDLPPVEIDPNQMQQVFVNLVNNAAQAIHASGLGDTVTVRAERWQDGVAVTVADNGPGIAPDIAHRVFEPFFTTKPEGEGTGLGLSICHGILEEHGGRISYAPGEGGGASFRVELPGVRAAAEHPGPAARRTGALRVLVVEDEPHILGYMLATLEGLGHRVAVAGTAEDALGRATAEPFDVIISDLRMPGVGGRELYERLLVERPELARRVVFATGDTVGGDVLQFLQSAGRPWLRKPFTLAELKQVLGEVG